MIQVIAYTELGYQPGLIGHCASMMARFYCTEYGFDGRYEAETATELSDFLTRFDSRYDGFWIARRLGPDGAEIVGCAAVDGRKRSHASALFRWFYLDPSTRGDGAGQRMLSRAIEHCRKLGYAAIELRTNERQQAAVHLYEKNGFERQASASHKRWGPLSTFVGFKRQLRPIATQLGRALLDRVHVATPKAEALAMA